MATFPTLKVEIAFASDPLDDTPTWTDVSAYVRQINGIDIRRGRVDPYEPFRSGRCSLTLSNRDRRFDSTHSTGPYYGNLKPRKQIRVSATWSSVDYEMFTGFVGVWPQQFTNKGKDAVVTIDCYDALDWSASTRLSNDLVYDHVDTSTTLEAFYRQADSTWVDASGTIANMSVIGTVPTGPSFAAGLNSPTLTFNGSGRFVPPIDVDFGAVHELMSVWVRVDELQATGDLMTIAASKTYGTSARFQLNVTTAGLVTASWFKPAPFSASGSVTSSRSIADGLPHLVTLVKSPITVMSLYIDGVFESSYTATGVSITVWMGVNLIGAMADTSGDAIVITNSKGLTVQDFVMGSAAMTAEQVATLYELGNGFATEDSATRMTRYLDDAAWPAAWRDITTTPRAEVSTIAYNNRQLTNALQELERSEQGRIFAAKDGKLTFHSRYFNFEVTRGTTSQATFSDDGASFGYSSFGFVEDDEYVRNDVTVKNALNQSRSTNSTSITAYGRRSETVDTILSTVAQVADMSDGLVVRWKDQAIRIHAFTVTPPSNWATVLGLELGDRITAEITPMATGSQIVKQLIIDSLDWSISDQGWWLTIGASPVPAGVFVLGTSSLDGTDVLGF